MVIIVNGLVEQEWMKCGCKKWILLDNSGSPDGSFYEDGDWIKTYKKLKMW